MNYSKELIKHLKENPFTNIDELIRKEKFVERHISPLAHTFGYEKAVYTLMFVDDKYYGEILQIYDRSLSVDFLVDVSANNNKGILDDFSEAIDDNDHRMYLIKFGEHIIKFISPIEAKQIMFHKEDTTIRGLLRMNIDIDVYDDDSDGIGIAFCGPVGLTDEGKKEWEDILDYKVSFVDGTICGDIAVVKIPDDVDYDEMLDRCSDFFGALAGYCSQSDWDEWFYWLEEDAE